MNYKLELNDVFTFKNHDYIVIDKINYLNTNYYFVNKLKNEDEPGDEFYVMKGLENGIIIETNENILKELYLIINKNINEQLDYFVNDENK